MKSRETPPESEKLDQTPPQEIEEIFAERARHKVTQEFLEGAVGYLHGENAGLTKENAELAELATKDHLTELDNRRSFLEKLRVMASKLAREGERGKRRREKIEHLIVGMFDIDHFKQFNDTYGHDVGDTVLKEVAKKIKASFRPEDTVGRYGGEEFVVALEDIDEETVLKRLGFDPEKKQNARIEIEILFGKEKHTVTLSGGLTEYHAGEQIEIALKRADETLYNAKKEGRNQIRTYEGIENRKAGAAG